MNRSYISDLVEYMPPDSFYFVSNGVGNTRSGRRALALNDPKFGWNFVKTLKEDDLSVPAAIGHLQILQAFAHLSGSENDAIDEALFLAEPSNTTARNLLKGLLISGDVTLENIAGWMQISLEAARVYDQLFFNVRDRRDEPGYIVQILNSDSIRLNRETNNEETLLLRAGVQLGAEEVIRLAGIMPNKRGNSLVAMRENIEQETLFRAMMSARHGGDQDLDSPAMASAMKLLVAEKRVQRDEPKQSGEADVLENLSVQFSVMETLRQLNRPALDRMLELERQGNDEKPKKDPKWMEF